LASTSTLRLVPDWARSVGWGPVFFPTQRRLGHRPVPTLPGPVQPLQFVIHFQSALPPFQEHPRLRPFLKPPVGRGTRTNPRGVQGLPLAAGPQDEQNPIEGIAVAPPRSAPPQRILVLMFRQQRLYKRPPLI
jgi:hypothetical protein